MAGLVPAIHVFAHCKAAKGVDARDKRGHDAPQSSLCIELKLRQPVGTSAPLRAFNKLQHDRGEEGESI
jgi:hypothetical protein